MHASFVNQSAREMTSGETAHKGCKIKDAAAQFWQSLIGRVGGLLERARREAPHLRLLLELVVGLLRGGVEYVEEPLWRAVWSREG